MLETKMHCLYVSIGSVPISEMTPFARGRLISRVFTSTLIGSILGVSSSSPLSPSHFEIGGQSKRETGSAFVL